MRNDFLTVWQFNGLLMAVLASISISTSCSNEMSSTYTSSVSPTPVGAKVLAAELPKCKDDVRPIRVALTLPLRMIFKKALTSSEQTHSRVL